MLQERSFLIIGIKLLKNYFQSTQQHLIFLIVNVYFKKFKQTLLNFFSAKLNQCYS